MIVDTLENASRYCPLHPSLDAALTWLATNDLTSLGPGRYEIAGEGVYALVSRRDARPRETVRLEAHRRFADIHLLLDGREAIGWRMRNTCSAPSTAYDPSADVEFFDDPPAVWLDAEPRGFIVFLPDDAHAPMAGEGSIRKVVIKADLGLKDL